MRVRVSLQAFSSIIGYHLSRARSRITSVQMSTAHRIKRSTGRDEGGECTKMGEGGITQHIIHVGIQRVQKKKNTRSKQFSHCHATTLYAQKDLYSNVYLLFFLSFCLFFYGKTTDLIWSVNLDFSRIDGRLWKT